MGYRLINAALLISMIIITLLLALSIYRESLIIGDIPQRVKDIEVSDIKSIKLEPWVEGLEIPWSLVFLPDGRALVSERPGRIRLIESGKLLPKPYAVIDVAHTGEAGLMGLAIEPDFQKKPFIYAMHTYKKDGRLYNRVIRLRDNGKEGVFDKVVIDGIPGGRFHDGGRIAFGPDGLLYITTGETGSPDLAQDKNSLGGKILRITPEGDIPPDNPFHSAVYSLGHRNPQGLAWRDGVLFSSEHGPSGEFGLFAHDEINIIKRGSNYGWPLVIGAGRVKGFEDPIVVWQEATPPSGMTFYSGKLIPELKGDLFVATLRSEALIRIRFKKETTEVLSIERWFQSRLGRLRDVVEGPDGAIYILTSNRDGRGSPRQKDDKIYRLTEGS